MTSLRTSRSSSVPVSYTHLDVYKRQALNGEVLKPEVLAAVYERTAKKIKEHFAHVPEELRLKKIELNRAETRVHNFIEFIASGRATPGLADALGQAEEQVKALTVDVTSMESAKDHAFTPPPRAWIEARVAKLNELLAARTEESALALRRLTGPVTLTPKKPEVGRPYFQAACRVDSLNLMVEEGSSSNLLQWWRRRESKSADELPARWQDRSSFEARLRYPGVFVVGASPLESPPDP